MQPWIYGNHEYNVQLGPILLNVRKTRVKKMSIGIRGPLENLRFTYVSIELSGFASQNAFDNFSTDNGKSNEHYMQIP